VLMHGQRDIRDAQSAGQLPLYTTGAPYTPMLPPILRPSVLSRVRTMLLSWLIFFMTATFGVHEKTYSTDSEASKSAVSVVCAVLAFIMPFFNYHISSATPFRRLNVMGLDGAAAVACWLVSTPSADWLL